MPGICPRCNKTVYFNEEKLAMGKLWHVSCFTCANASCCRRLDSGNLTEHDGEIFCRPCYGKLFGPKGYGFGTGAGVLSMDPGNSSNFTDGRQVSNVPSTAEAYVAPLSTRSPRHSSESCVIKNVSPNWGGSSECRRCGKVVYMAEKMMGAGSHWHKTTCFTCKECNRKLESGTLCEREGEIYCKTCYGRMFGPKGYGCGSIRSESEVLLSPPN